MVGEVWPLVNLMVLYVFGVKLVGPRMMKDRRPFDIRHIVLCYNFLMILACVFFLTELIRLAYVHNRYSPFLQEVDMTYRPATLRLVSLSWWYYLLRVFEFTEAVFFVLKKKFSQASGLHIFHHCAIAWNMWMCVKYGIQAQGVFVTCLNIFVHLVMYTYYFLSALGPWTQRFLWWKRYLTQIQLVQFVIIMIHSSLPLFFSGHFAKLMSVILVVEGLVFFVWFMIFYFNSYRIKKPIMIFECNKMN